MRVVSLFSKSKTVAISELAICDALNELAQIEARPIQESESFQSLVLAQVAKSNRALKSRQAEISKYAQYVLSTVDKTCRWLEVQYLLKNEMKVVGKHLRILAARAAFEKDIFFRDADHATRRLLDDAVECLVGSAEFEGDEFAQKVVALIIECSQQTEWDPELYRQIKSLMRAEWKGKVLAADRVKRSILSRIEHERAQDHANTILSRVLARYAVPVAMKSLALAWQSHLVKLYLESHRKTDYWYKQAGVFENLLAYIEKNSNGVASEGRDEKIQSLTEWSGLIASMLRTLELPEERFVAILKNCDAVFKDLVRGKSIPMETLTLPGAVAPEDEIIVDLGEITYLQLSKIDDFEDGMWFSFEEDPTQPPVICQLLCKIPEPERLLFCVRKGPKLFQKSYAEFSSVLETGVCKHVAHQNAFSAALQKTLGDRVPASRFSL